MMTLNEASKDLYRGLTAVQRYVTVSPNHRNSTITVSLKKGFPTNLREQIPKTHETWSVKVKAAK